MRRNGEIFRIPVFMMVIPTSPLKYSLSATIGQETRFARSPLLRMDIHHLGNRVPQIDIPTVIAQTSALSSLILGLAAGR
jgi:hypothetical protein